MGRKKESVKVLIDTVNDAEKKLAKQHQRVSDNIGKGLLSVENFKTLGEYNNEDLRRIGSFLSDYIPKCIERLESEKEARLPKTSRAIKDTTSVPETMSKHTTDPVSDPEPTSESSPEPTTESAIGPDLESVPEPQSVQLPQDEYDDYSPYVSEEDLQKDYDDTSYYSRDE